MSSTPKWYCRSKSQPMNTFGELNKLSIELRRITKRIIIDVKVDIFSEHDTVLDECEKIIEQYWALKDETKNQDLISLSKKIKRSPYNALLVRKYNCLMDLCDHRFCQLTFVLKKTVIYLLRKSTQSDVWLNWALKITQLYNKCCEGPVETDPEENADSTKSKPEEERKQKMNANVCSNMYPALLLPLRIIEFSHVLQVYSQTRIEQNSLDLMFGLFNMGEQGPTWHDKTGESTCSSLEILRILTLNLTNDGEFQQYYDHQGAVDSDRDDALGVPSGNQSAHVLRRKHVEHFLQKERAFIAQLITRANEICPTIFGKNSNSDLNRFITRGMLLIWSYVSIILDHIILWWIDTPISCYSLTHVDSIRQWLQHQSVDDIPEPVYSTLHGIGEVLTNFICNTTWDQLFRLTLISNSCSREVVQKVIGHYRGIPENDSGTPIGTVWIALFHNLVNLSNNYFPSADIQNSSMLPVAEQIPILHRIDHSVHCMRLWVTEQAKLLCCEWKMDIFFQILQHDVRKVLDIFINFKLPKLTADLTDILMLVCVALRTKLITEVNANIAKLKKTTEECVQILSSVCRILSLANFTLCFPPAQYWQRNAYDNDAKSEYVGYVLDNIFLPTIKATNDLNLLKLILKLICEAWLDFIYQKRIHFSVNGAVRLLNDFDDVREWILACSLLEPDHMEKLSNHEVLRMCKGVGKILLRKPEDVISIAHSPKYDKKSADTATQETQLPSEMFVSNQKHWLQLRASGNRFSFLPKFCCGDDVL